MEMENRLHLYLYKLRIVSKIPVGGKLDITYNDINIYYGGFIGWVYRKLSGDNKDNAAKHLIDLYKEINEFGDQLMYIIQSETNKILIIKKLNMLVSLTDKLKESLVGVRNLIGTYKQYLKVVSLLECLEQDVIIRQYNALIDFIQNIYTAHDIKNSDNRVQLNTSNSMSNTYINSLYDNKSQTPINLKVTNPIDIIKPTIVNKVYAHSAPIDIPLSS
jgi:hypothetical protein